MGEGWHRGQVAGERMGKEARPEGAPSRTHRFRALQGSETEEAGTFRGQEVVGQGQGSCEIRGSLWHGERDHEMHGLLGSLAYSEALYATSKKAGVKCIWTSKTIRNSVPAKRCYAYF